MKFVYKSILLFFCLSLFLVLPQNKEQRMPSPIDNTFFAHRGLPQLAENSQEGFLQSKSVGFTAVETDVNFTKDHKLVLLHDNNLKRLLGIDKDINDLNWQDIENLNIRHEDKISSNNVLTLEDLLQEDYGFQTVYLDFKTTSKTRFKATTSASSIPSGTVPDIASQSFFPDSPKKPLSFEMKKCPSNSNIEGKAPSVPLKFTTGSVSTPIICTVLLDFLFEVGCDLTHAPFY